MSGRGQVVNASCLCWNFKTNRFTRPSRSLPSCQRKLIPVFTSSYQAFPQDGQWDLAQSRAACRCVTSNEGTNVNTAYQTQHVGDRNTCLADRRPRRRGACRVFSMTDNQQYQCAIASVPKCFQPANSALQNSAV